MNWDLKTLVEIGNWGSGGTPLSSRMEYYNGTIPWLIIEDLNDNIVIKSQRTITELGLKNSSAKMVNPGTLLIAMYGSIGKLGVAGIKCATNQAIAFCEILNESIDIWYIFYYLLYSRPKLLNEGRGNTQQNINQTFLKDYPIPLPPLPEQQRIAAILQKADRIRQLRRYARQLSDTYLQSVFLEMFGDPETNPKGWKVGIVNDLIQESQYGTSTKSNSERKGYPILGMSNITFAGNLDLSSIAYVELTDNEFRELQLERGDVIFNRTNSTELVGKTTYWNVELDAVLASYLVKLKLNRKALPEFFSFLLNTSSYKNLFQERCKKAVGQSNVSPTLLKEFPVFIPPIELQKQFSNLVNSYQLLAKKQVESSRQAEHLFQSLLQRAFQGEL